MSGYNQYSNYGGNPYGGEEQAGGYGSSGNPYGSANPYGSENPYGADYGQQPVRLSRSCTTHAHCPY
jgi:syntaxin 1B/2/3